MRVTRRRVIVHRQRVAVASGVATYCRGRSLRACRRPLERASRLLLEHRERWLEEHQHLSSALERERLDACGDGGGGATKAVRPAATVASVSAKGSAIARI